MARVVLAVLFICLIIAPAIAGEPTPKADTLVSARAAVLMDRATGLVLWRRNADQRLPMASTTKIMTAMVILDLGADKLDERVTVSKYAASTGGSSQFGAGDVVALRDLLKAALIRSSNEATVAAAEFLAGSEDAFVARMNDKAAELGLTHTHFVNPHGLWDPKRGKDHYTSAHDLALMARYALTNYPLIRQTVTLGRPRPEWATASPRGRVILENRNKLLNQPVPGIPGSRVDGVKTGYVKEAGHCLVASATLEGWQLIAVVLDSPDTFQECSNLLYYGFHRYVWKTYASDVEAGVSAPVRLGAQRLAPLGVNGELGAPVPRPEFSGPADDEVVFVGPRLRAPVRRGAEVGTLEVRRDGRVIVSAPAIALESVPVAWWARLFAVLGYTALVIFALVVIGSIYGARAKNHRRRRRLLATARGGVDPGRASDG